MVKIISFEKDRVSASRGGAEREREREREKIPSRLTLPVQSLTQGTNSPNHEIMI